MFLLIVKATQMDIADAVDIFLEPGFFMWRNILEMICIESYFEIKDPRAYATWN